MCPWPLQFTDLLDCEHFYIVTSSLILMFLQGPDTTRIGSQSVSPGNPTLTAKIPKALQLLWEQQDRGSGARQPGWSLMGSALLTLEQRALQLPKPREIQSSAIGLSLPVLQRSEAHFSSKEPPGKPCFSFIEILQWFPGFSEWRNNPWAYQSRCHFINSLFPKETGLLNAPSSVQPLSRYTCGSLCPSPSPTHHHCLSDTGPHLWRSHHPGSQGCRHVSRCPTLWALVSGGVRVTWCGSLSAAAAIGLWGWSSLVLQICLCEAGAMIFLAHVSFSVWVTLEPTQYSGTSE